MSFIALSTCAVLVLHALAGLANPLSEITGTSVRRDSDELLMTPAGLFTKSNIHAVPEGATVHQTSDAVHLIASDGTILHTAPPVKTAQRSVSPRAFSSGYVAYSYWHNNNTSPISSFTTSWAVPAAPATKNGQILYIFNALEPGSFDGIFQAVLQFGSTPAGGGNYWAVASWYLIGSSIYYTVPAQVKVGQVLTGALTLNSMTTSGTTTTYKYNSVFTGIPSTSLTISTTEVFNYAYEALEIYSATTASYVPKGSTLLSNVTITTKDGLHPTLNWTAISDSTDGFKMTVINSASVNGQLEITYP